MYLYLFLVYLGASITILCVWDAQSFRVPPGTRLCLTSAAKKYANRTQSNSSPNPATFVPPPRAGAHTPSALSLLGLCYGCTTAHSHPPPTLVTSEPSRRPPLILTHPRPPRIAVDRARARYMSLRWMLSRRGSCATNPARAHRNRSHTTCP